MKYTHSHLLKWFHTGHIKQERQRSTETPCKRNKLQVLDIYSMFTSLSTINCFWYFFLRKWVKWFCQAIKFNSAQSNVILSGKLDLCLRDLGDAKNIFQITSMKNDPYNCTACHIEYSITTLNRTPTLKQNIIVIVIQVHIISGWGTHHLPTPIPH